MTPSSLTMNSIGKRLRQLRIARGMSLDDLVVHMGGQVTKASISKYENEKSMPSPLVINRLAKALSVKPVDLWGEPAVAVEVLAFRCNSRLGKTEKARLQSLLAIELERRLRLQTLLAGTSAFATPVLEYEVTQVAEAEEAAQALREVWELGQDPLPSVVNTLEDHGVHVVQLDAQDGFDGISALAKDSETNECVGAAVMTRPGVPGDRQRFSLAHELGHLVLRIPDTIDDKVEEKLVHRFAAAFLAPRDQVFGFTGKSRHSIDLVELLLLKKTFGMSMQAAIYRLCDLDVITQNYGVQLWKFFNQAEWRKQEPLELPSEQPQWYVRSVHRAFAEGLISKAEAEQMLGSRIEGEETASLIERKALMSLPIEERRRVLELQAREATAFYSENPEYADVGGDDFADD